MSDNTTVIRPIKRERDDTLEETLTSNAYNNILPARYLRKDENGDPVESPEQLFTRVAKNIALGDLPHLAAEHDDCIQLKPEHIKPDHPRRDELAADALGPITTEGTREPRPASAAEHVMSKFNYDALIDDLPTDVAGTIAVWSVVSGYKKTYLRVRNIAY